MTTRLLACVLLALLAACAEIQSALKPSDAPKPAAPQITEGMLRERAKEQLATGIRQYEAGDYENASKSLSASLDHGLLSKQEQATARKNLAFIHCVSNREAACRDEFRKAFEIYPEFSLSAAEDGHPIWGPIYRNVRTQLIMEREAAQERGRPIIPLSKSEQMLADGIVRYNSGDYDGAIRLLESALKEGLPEKADKVRAMKHIAFSFCLKEKYRECRAEFVKIYDVDPAFDLTPAEVGHPSWTKTFAAAKAQAKKAIAAREAREKSAKDKSTAPKNNNDNEMISTLGRYKIVSEIGQGAMGVVYKAVDPIIDRTVAIKTINLNLSRQELEEYEQRFQQEIKAAGRLNHPNIVTIYDVGKTDQVAYMAMEFLEGAELKDMIASGNLPGVDQVVDIIAQVADGLWFAHQQDIVHRDVKPSNIMVLKGGIAKITDFGIARLPNSAVKTMTGLILGSPRYMSPEQVIGKTIDARSDIFSLGVVLYESLTSMAPFDGDNVNAIMYSTVNTTPPPPSSHNRAIPAMLDLIAAKAMAKLLEDRYQSVKEFADDLREVRRQMDAGRPAAALKASTPAMSRPQAVPSSAPERHVDTATMPMGLEAGATKAKDDEAKPLSLAKTFDSFDATLRLAAMTDQTEDFRDYITATQKMRAYKGKIESTSPLAPKPAPAPAAPAAEERRNKPAFRPMPPPAASAAAPASGATNLAAVAAIVVLAIAAVALAIALLIK